MARRKRERPISPGGTKSAPVRAALRVLFESSFDGMLLLGRQGCIVDANPRASRLFGLPMEGIIGKRVRDLVKVRQRRVSMVDAPDAAWIFLTLERQDKSLVDIFVRDVRNLAPRMCVRILREVAAESLIMEALEKKTRLLEEMERVGRIGAWEIDVKAGVVVRTPEMCRIMEVTSGREMMTSIEDSYNYYTESSRTIIREAFAAALARGTPYDLELEVVTGQGNRIWVREVCCATMRKGRLVSLFGIAQDITERRRLAELVANAADRERARLGADLHDGLGQDLTGLALLLRGAATRAASDGRDLARELGELASLASKAVKTARAIAHGMLPVDLSDGGFAGALQHLSRSTSAAFGVVVSVRCDGDKRYRPVGTAAENLYRIAQEAITNAVKHGHPKQVSLLVNSSETQTVLIVSNDGNRIDLDRATEGMGLEIMRHRARMLGGLVEVQPLRKGGTRVRCVVPRDVCDSG
jgi:signal transduction histidine kinase